MPDPGVPSHATTAPAGLAEAHGGSQPEEPARGSQVGRFVVLERLGEGGMGTVFTAYDPVLDRKVALKLLQTALPEEGYRERLVREAQALARLTHPNVIAVHDVGAWQGRTFLAMEYVDGEPLHRVLAVKPDWSQVLRLFIDAGRGLAAAHAAGLIHRDFKPQNVIVGKDGRVRVLDFGLARSMDPAALPGTSNPSLPALSGPDPDPGSGSGSGQLGRPLTRGSTFMGTPAYMSPEQFFGHTSDHRSDQFSFCVALHEGLYGNRPFSAESLEGMAGQLRQAEVPPPPAGSPVPRAVHEVLLRGLRAKPEERFPTMDELLDALAPRPPSRRRRVVPFVALGALSLVAGAVGRELLREAPCRDSAGRLAGVWDAARKEQVQKALLATSASFASGVWRGVERELDRYAAAWAQQRQSACEATQVRREQSAEMMDLRIGCLERRRQELGALAAELTRADAKLAERAVQAAFALSPVDACQQVDVLAARVRPPPDPASRAKLDALGEQLAAVKTLAHSGRYAQALPQAEKVAAEAAALGYAPFEGEAQLELGSVLYDSGEHARARDAFWRAAVAAERGRDGPVKVHALARLGNVWGYDLKDFAQADSWASLADAAVEAAPPDEALRARVDLLRGSVLTVQAKLPEATAKVESALQRYERALGPDRVEIAQALNQLGNVYGEAGNYRKAGEAYARAIEIYKRLLGPEHPQVGKVLTNLGSNALKAKDTATAVRSLEEALQLLERALGKDSPVIGVVLYNLAEALVAAERLDEATTIYRRVLEADEKELGPDHSNVAADLTGLAGILMDRKQFDEAETLFLRSLGIVEKKLGPEHSSAGFGRFNLGNFELRRGRPRQAIPYLEKALAIHQKAFGPRHRWVAEALSGLGQAHLELKDAAGARPFLERSVGIYDGEKLQGGANARFYLARALWDSGGARERALGLAKAAREELAVKAPELKEARAGLEEVDRWLAGR